MAKSTSKTSTKPKSKAKAAAGDDAAPAEKSAGRSAGGRGRRSAGRGPRQSYTAGSAKGKNLVIVESPSKAKTINKYLGPDYVVLASIGHVRDLPSKNPKGDKSPVPGVDLKHRFAPTYQILEGKEKVISDLKRAAKDATSTGGNVWFATDLDREGEAIAWHLAQELGISSKEAKRVIFAAITKAEIEKAFNNPHPIDEDRVNAQQARRILDRIVGYQVSPMLWKKVARGLSAGRVQSVAVRLVVEREREIRAFTPDEYWAIQAAFTPDLKAAPQLAADWAKALARRDEKNQPPTQRALNAWLAEHGGFKADLVEIDGKKFELTGASGAGGGTPLRGESSSSAFPDLSPRVAEIAAAAGLTGVKTTVTADDKAKGPARSIRTVTGQINPATPYRVTGIETKRTTSRPAPPFITSTLQQAASSRLGFGAQRTMRAAQQLYEGVEVPGEGPVGLITYMRTDSTHLSREALEMARVYIGKHFGDRYLPEKPNFFSSSNKAAQEAHEAIRPTALEHTPSRLKNALTSDQFRLYQLIWERFVACQMTPAQWDSTAITIQGGASGGGTPLRGVQTAPTTLTFRATGRTLAFDGFYKATGVPLASDEQTLPSLKDQQPVAPFAMDPRQKFTQPPPRYSEASLIKMLESEGIGRPSTYASIISVIQERNYVEQLERRFYSTDLGEVVTDKLIEAFPRILDVGYTREMESQLDKVEEDHLDWVEMLNRFYGPFKDSLEHALETLSHAKAEVTPAPPEYKCPQCGAGLVYRFGKNGRFLSCSTYPACNYASPVDREGRPRPAAESVNVACPKCGSPMTKRVGRFGPFLGCSRYGDKTSPCDGILNLDKKHKVTAPSQPPLLTDLPCPTCEAPLNLRNGARGPWLSCSRFPKCRGRGKWAELAEDKRAALEDALKTHDRANPIPTIRTLDGKPLTDPNGKPLSDAPAIEALSPNAGASSEGDPGPDLAAESEQTEEAAA